MSGFHPGVRRSPYHDAAQEAGAAAYMVYNHMYMPADFGRDPAEDYAAVTEGVALWDVGGERQLQLRGPDALRFADYLVTNDVSGLEPGRCKYTFCCDDDGLVICDPVMLVPEPDTVWLSHGPVDLLLWARGIALHTDYDVEVTEPDISPMQVPGPKSRDVLRRVLGDAIDDLAYYRCMKADVDGAELVVSRTGWSGGLGYELFPLDRDQSLGIWERVAEAGAPEGILVQGPNVPRAMECGITDTSYYASLGVNALEMGRPHLVDLEKERFIGREALARIAEEGPARATVGLLGPSERLPRMQDVWDVLSAGGEQVGHCRWSSFSPSLQRAMAIAVIETGSSEPGTEVRLVHPDGEAAMTVSPLPFVEVDRGG